MTDAMLEHPWEAMRATDPDEAIGRNVKRLRVKCGRTIDDVVKAMQKARYRWNATTQSNIERGAVLCVPVKYCPCCDELSNRMLGLLESIAADRFDYLSPNNGQSTSRISCRPR